MPTKAENLNKDSSPEEVKGAVSDCIGQLIKEGRSKEQAVAICYSQASKSSGKDLSKRKSTTIE